MAQNKVYTVKYRRKREGKTDYKKRLKLLLGGKPRLVIRKSNKHLSLQIIETQPKGDKVLFSAHTKELEKQGWKAGTGNTSAAYLTGLLLAKKVNKKIEIVADLGQNTSVKGSKLYAAIQGCVDGGLKVPCSKEIIPKAERIRGEHIAAYAKKTNNKTQFKKLTEAGIAPEKLPEHFDKVKSKIGGQ